MFKNTASQSVELFAFDTTTGAAKTGDSANMVFYVTKDFGTVTAIAASSGVPTEMDATNAKGLYKIALSQAETNADHLTFSGKSSTSNISVVAKGIDTLPANFTKLVVDANGLADATAIKVGPTGAATAQTARDLGASVIAASVATGGIVAASFAAGAIDAAAIATDALGALELASGAAIEIADAILDRDMSTGVDSGSPSVRTVRQALRFLRNKWAVVTGTLTVYKEDDSTSSWTAAVTTDAAAVPIVSNDPA